jgi:nitrate/TMAO reductase-like tetraheme cytochrome c subunit
MAQADTGNKQPWRSTRLQLGGIAMTLVIAVVVLLGAYGGFEYYTSQSSFCGGSCHTMTEQHQAWQADFHYAGNNDMDFQAECIDCHFLPGEHGSMKAKYEGLRHLAAYLYDRDAPLPIRPAIPDGSCLQSGCHDNREFEEKELRFADKVRFKHDIHLGDKALKGQQLSCDTCHFKVTEEKHFEVPPDVCYLCHLKLEKPVLEKAKMAEVGIDGIIEISFADRPTIDFNQGISRCDICHEIPTRSLQSQLTLEEGDSGAMTKKPITHQSIQEAGVPCESCHFEVVSGSGEIVTGNVVSNGCLRCHNSSQTLIATAGDRELMHDSHVSNNKADCFDCHATIEHRNRTDHLDFVRNDCQLCHADQHRFQRLLLSGTPVNENLVTTPHLMFDVNTNCMGCHLKKTVNSGHLTRTASGETCVACHTDRHAKMLEDWGEQLDSEVGDATEYEAEVIALYEEVKHSLGKELVDRVEAGLNSGRELLNIVRYGNGVHNKKYAIMILDEAFGNFDDAMEILEDAQ